MSSELCKKIDKVVGENWQCVYVYVEKNSMLQPMLKDSIVVQIEVNEHS